MQVGTLVIRLLLRESHSLKDKRRVVKSLVDRLRGQFNASVAEIESLDAHQQAVLGVAVVGTERRELESALYRMLDLVRAARGAELVSQEIDFLY